MVFPIVGGDGKPTGYDVENSARFFSNTDLKRLPSATGQSVRGTLSVWVKFSTDDTEMAIIGGYDNSGANDDDGYMVFKRLSTGELQFNGGEDVYLKTSAKYRDVSAWYHIVLAIDSAQNSNNSQRIYVNGSEVTSFDTRNNLTNLQDLPMNTTAGNDDALIIGADEDTGGKGLHFHGYMAEFFWIDSTQYAASNFGETNDNGVWIPKNGSDIVDDLTMGTNGVYLEFKQTGTSANSSGIGADTSGNDNHFTVTNLAAQDITTDTCTNNFMTWNPLDSTDPSDLTYSEGNTKVVNATGVCRGTLAAKSGKWYWEIKQITAVDASNPIQYGIADTEDSPPTHSSLNNALIAYSDNGTNKAIKKFVAGTESTVTNTMGSFNNIAQNDIIMFAFDADTAKLWVGRNGTWLNSGDPAAGSNEVASTTAGNFFTPCLEHAGVTYTIESNFGNPPYSVSSSQADDAGYGNFEYDVPAGFYSWNTKNLAKHG